MIIRALTTLSIACALGCAASVPNARVATLAPGELEIAGGASAGAIVAAQPSSTPMRAPVAYAGLGARAGVFDRIDVGARVFGGGWPAAFAAGAALDAKLMFLDGETWMFDGAVAPTVGYQVVVVGGAPIHATSASLPLLFAWDLPGAHEVAAGATFSSELWFSSTAKPIATIAIAPVVQGSFRLFDVLDVRPMLTIAHRPISLAGVGYDRERHGVVTTEASLSVAFPF